MGFFDSLFKAGSILQDPFTGALGLGAAGDKGRSFLGGLPFVGGIFKGAFGDPAQEAMQRAFQDASGQLTKQRANLMDARTNAMNQGALAFGPRNEMLGQMMGKQGSAMDLTGMLQNPMPQVMQQDIRKAAFGGSGLPPPSVPLQGGSPYSTGQQNPFRRYV